MGFEGDGLVKFTQHTADQINGRYSVDVIQFTEPPVHRSTVGSLELAVVLQAYDGTKWTEPEKQGP